MASALCILSVCTHTDRQLNNKACAFKTIDPESMQKLTKKLSSSHSKYLLMHINAF